MTSEKSNLFNPRQPQPKEKEYIRPDFDQSESSLRQPIIKDQKVISRKSEEHPAMDDLTRDFQKKVEVTQKVVVKEESKSNNQGLAGKEKPAPVKINGNILFDTLSNLSELKESGSAVELSNRVKFLVIDHGHFEFFFEIYTEANELLYKRRIQNDLNYHVDDSAQIFKWVDYSLETGNIVVYVCKIPKEKISIVKLIFAQCLFEASNQVKY